MTSIELTPKNIEKVNSRYPTPLPTAFTRQETAEETSTSVEKGTNVENHATLARHSSTNSVMSTTDSVISKNPRRRGDSNGEPKRRRMSTIDVLYQMQTQQLEQSMPTKTCSGQTIHPHSDFRTKWDVLIAICLAYNALAIPYRICFDQIAATDEFIFYFDRLVDFLFLVDVILNFYTGYIKTNDGQIELEPKLVKMNYLKTWFLPDIISSIPYELIILVIVGFEYGPSGTPRGAESTQLLKSAKTLKIAKYIRFVKLVKALRLLRAVHIVKRFEKALVMRHNSLSILKFCMFIFYLNHIMACIFFLIGDLEFKNGRKSWLEVDNVYTEDPSVAYLYAFYWSLMTITTIGYGDVHPISPAGRFFGLIAMVIGATVFAYGVTNVLEMMSAMNQQEQAFREKMDRISSYMTFRNLPKGLKEDVREFFHYTHSTKTEKRMLKVEKEILAEMSPSLSHEVILFVNRSIVNKVAFFRECDHRFFQRIVRSLEPATFAPNELVMKEGEHGTKLYIISKGVVELLYGEDLERLDTRADGAHFGMVSIMDKGPSKGRRICSVRTMTYCDFRTISKRAFNRGLSRYPGVRDDVSRLVDIEYKEFKRMVRKAMSRQDSPPEGTGSDGPNGLQRIDSFGEIFESGGGEEGGGEEKIEANRTDSNGSLGSSVTGSPPQTKKKGWNKVKELMAHSPLSSKKKGLNLKDLRRHSDMRSPSVSFGTDRSPSFDRKPDRRHSDMRDIIEEEEDDPRTKNRSPSMDMYGGGAQMSIEQLEQMSSVMARMEMFLDEHEEAAAAAAAAATEKKNKDIVIDSLKSSETSPESKRNNNKSLGIETQEYRDALSLVLEHAIDEEEETLGGMVLGTGGRAPPPPPLPLEKRKEEVVDGE